MNRGFIIHGYGGVPDDAWKPWLKRSLQDRGFEVSAPAMPDPAHPRLADWVRTIKAVVGRADPDCYMIGHSLGCAAVLRFLETLPDEESVGGCVFIAGFADSGNPEFDTFFESPIDWERIRKACEQSVAVYSDNDPHVSLHNARTFEQKLGAQIVIEHDKGHLGAPDGVTDLPVVLEAILRFASI